MVNHVRVFTRVIMAVVDVHCGTMVLNVVPCQCPTRPGPTYPTYPTMPDPVRPALSHLTLSCPTIPGPARPCPTRPALHLPTLSDPTYPTLHCLTCPTPPYPTRPYLTLPDPVLRQWLSDAPLRRTNRAGPGKDPLGRLPCLNSHPAAF